MKLRASTDGSITTGWMNAMTYAFIEGETFPLYRLLAATWARFEKAGDRYRGSSLEIAFFLDPTSGQLLKSLTMPRTGQTVDVPLYRAGPSPSSVAVRADDRREFGMANETRSGTSFFRPGIAVSAQRLSQAERDGDMFQVREDLDTRVTPGDPAAPKFFYREWSIYRGDWNAVMNPRTASAQSQVIYSAATAYRPWMKMGATPGHTLQNGQGGKVQRAADLPAQLLALVREHHPDLLEAPEKALTLKPAA